MYVCVCVCVVISDPRHRVLKSHRSKVSVIYMQYMPKCMSCHKALVHIYIYIYILFFFSWDNQIIELNLLLLLPPNIIDLIESFERTFHRIITKGFQAAFYGSVSKCAWDINIFWDWISHVDSSEIK